MTDEEVNKCLETYRGQFRDGGHIGSLMIDETTELDIPPKTYSKLIESQGGYPAILMILGLKFAIHGLKFLTSRVCKEWADQEVEQQQ